MANFSPSGDLLVIRLVYDGPPRSGKTTTLAALAGSLARPLVSPEEALGRTLFFDWVEYVGGSFEGLPIRCQIVSVPGQRALARRRQALLATADVVVFVADTTAAGLAETVDCLESLRTLLAARAGPPIGLVLQANMRDRTDALPLAALRDRLGLAGAACVESVATDGVGIREAFVLAVRLALDHVRELMAAGAVRRGLAAAETADQLLAQVKAYEAGTPPVAERRGADRRAAERRDAAAAAPAAAILREVLAREDADGLRAAPHGVESPGTVETVEAVKTAEAAAAAGADEPERPPRLPDSSAPSGRVWPPIEGRVLLHETSGAAATPRRHADGSWLAEVGSWRLHSLGAHRFHDLEAGKQALLRWARLHAGGFERLAAQRCLVLADTGAGGWRLWQVVAAAESLQRALARRLLETDAQEAARTLLSTAAHLLAARAAFAAEPRLPCRLAAIGLSQGRVVYAGLLPPPAWRDRAGEMDEDDAVLIRREIEPVLRKVLPVSRLDVARTLDALQAEQPATAEGRRIRETVAALLIGS
jgi:hypothetical protein